jgi:transcriptional/translational regulatory protein YebC/TACO1
MAADIEPDSKALTRLSCNAIEIRDVETAKSVLQLMETLDDHDDVQNVSSNITISNEAMAAAGAD